LLEACRGCHSIKAIINVTTDKVYDNEHRIRNTEHRAQKKKKAFIEKDPLGGYDPYSSSKACSEMVTAAYRSSFLSPVVAVATARAGNVIGGGDWAKDRLIPDFVRAILKNEKIYIRNPQAVRPWQHVLEPLTGYLLLAEKLCKQGGKFAGAWNFGPDENDTRTVAWIVKKLCRLWGEGCSYIIDKGKHPHEAPYLRLDSAKARQQLKWGPKWNLTAALDKIIVWMRAYQAKENLREICFRQIEEHLA
jgi:CDP-glucose 4,6-dehydratase